MLSMMMIMMMVIKDTDDDDIDIINSFVSLGINGGYSGWSGPKKCTQSCGGGVRLQKRKCNNPKPSLNGKDCYGPNKRLAATEWCNMQVNYTDKNICNINSL